MSASQNVTINIPWKKTPKEWQPCFLQKLKMWSIAMVQPKCFSQSEHHSYCFTEENPWGVTVLFCSEAKAVEHSSVVIGWLIPNKTFKISMHAHSLMLRNIILHQIRQITITWILNQTQFIVNSTGQYRTTWWSNWKLVKKEPAFGAQHRTLCCLV